MKIFGKWHMLQNNLPYLPKQTFRVESFDSVTISRNFFKGLRPYAFQFEVDGRVNFSFNTVEIIKSNAFHGIMPNKMKLKTSSIVIVNNTFFSVDQDSLVLSDSYYPHNKNVADNKFHKACHCNITDTFRHMLGVNRNYSYAEVLHKAALESFQCLSEANSEQYMYNQQYVQNKCTQTNYIVITLSTIAVLVLACSVGVAVYRCRRNRYASESMKYIAGRAPRPRHIPTPYDEIVSVRTVAVLYAR